METTCRWRHVSKKINASKKYPARIKKTYVHQKKISRCHCVRPHGFRAANLDQKKIVVVVVVIVVVVVVIVVVVVAKEIVIIVVIILKKSHPL